MNFGCNNNNNTEKNTPCISPGIPLTFPWHSVAIKCSILVRVAVVLLLHTSYGRRYSSVWFTRPSSSLFAILVDPWWAAHQLREDVYRDTLAYRNKLTFHHWSKKRDFMTQPNYYSNTKSSSLGLRALLSPIFSTTSNSNLLLGILLSFVDLLVSYYLYEVAKDTLWNDYVNAEIKLEQSMDQTLHPKKYYLFGIGATSPNDIQSTCIIPYNHIPSLVSIMYFCNPISVISSCAALSCQSIAFALFLLTFHCAYLGQTWQTGLFLGMLTIAEQDLFFLYAMAIPVLSLLLRKARNNRNKRVRTVITATVSASLLGATFLSIFIFSIYIIYSTRTTNKEKHAIIFLHYLLLHNDSEERNLSPSLSLQWYFYQQVFHQFQLYFKIILEVAPYIFIIPLTIRLHRFPLSLVSAIQFQ